MLNRFDRAWLWILIPLVVLLWQPLVWAWANWSSVVSPFLFQLAVPLGALALALSVRDEWSRTRTELATLFPQENSGKRVGNLLFVLVGCVGMTVAYLAEVLPLGLFSFWLIVVGVIFYLYGPFLVKVVWRALLFLLLVIPLPAGVLGRVTSGFQLASAIAVGQSVQALGIKVRIFWKSIYLVASGDNLDITPFAAGIFIIELTFVLSLFLALLKKAPLLRSLSFVVLCLFLTLVLMVARMVFVVFTAAKVPEYYPLLLSVNEVLSSGMVILVVVALGNRILTPRLEESFA